MAQVGVIAQASDLYTFVTSLLNGVQLDQALFQTKLNVAQLRRELARDWQVLRKSDTSQTANSGDIFTTAKNLPSDFLKWSSAKYPVRLVDSITNPTKVFYYRPIGYEDRLDYQFDSDRFYCDYANYKLYLCGGNLTAQYTIVQDYIFKPARMIYDGTKTGSGSTAWSPFANGPFSSEAMAMLGYDIAAMEELGVDYDDLNARMGNENARIAEQLMEVLVRWDAKLAKDAARGREMRRQDVGIFRDKSLPFSPFS